MQTLGSYFSVSLMGTVIVSTSLLPLGCFLEPPTIPDWLLLQDCQLLATELGTGLSNTSGDAVVVGKDQVLQALGRQLGSTSSSVLPGAGDTLQFHRAWSDTPGCRQHPSFLRFPKDKQHPHRSAGSSLENIAFLSPPHLLPLSNSSPFYNK